MRVTVTAVRSAPLGASRSGRWPSAAVGAVALLVLGGCLKRTEDATEVGATGVCVVHHVLPAEWPSFFAEMRRILRPGGFACVIEHNPLNPATRLAVLRCPFDDDAVLLRSRMTGKLMRDAGFGDVSSEFFLVLPTANAAARRIERCLSRLPLGAQYACIARA